MRLLNQAHVRLADTIDPSYTGTKGLWGPSASFGNMTTAAVAKAVATDPSSVSQFFPGVDVSKIRAVSEGGFTDRRGNMVYGSNIYLASRFFDLDDPSKLLTIFIHELNRLKGFNGTPQEDYANIIKACGTANPFPR